jgi:hypothetical protein
MYGKSVLRPALNKSMKNSGTATSFFLHVLSTCECLSKSLIFVYYPCLNLRVEILIYSDGHLLISFSSFADDLDVSIDIFSFRLRNSKVFLAFNSKSALVKTLHRPGKTGKISSTCTYDYARPTLMLCRIHILFYIAAPNFVQLNTTTTTTYTVKHHSSARHRVRTGLHDAEFLPPWSDPVLPR